jgi:hypothetical protein
MPNTSDLTAQILVVIMSLSFEIQQSYLFLKTKDAETPDIGIDFAPF